MSHPVAPALPEIAPQRGEVVAYDAQTAAELARTSVAQDVADDEGAPLGVFGLGQTRTLQDFSDFCGIDYRTRTITRRPGLSPLVGTGSQI